VFEEHFAKIFKGNHLHLVNGNLLNINLFAKLGLLGNDFPTITNFLLLLNFRETSQIKLLH